MHLKFEHKNILIYRSLFSSLDIDEKNREKEKRRKE